MLLASPKPYFASAVEESERRDLETWIVQQKDAAPEAKREPRRGSKREEVIQMEDVEVGLGRAVWAVWANGWECVGLCWGGFIFVYVFTYMIYIPYIYYRSLGPIGQRRSVCL